MVLPPPNRSRGRPNTITTMYRELITVLTALAPVAELRGAIPLALAFGFSPLKTYLLAVLANLCIAPLALVFLYHGSEWAMQRSPWLRRLLERVFERTRQKHSARFNQAGLAALTLFVAVPLPGTGAWTGSLIAFLFDMPIRTAVWAMSIGVVIAGGLMLAVSLGVISVL